MCRFIILGLLHELLRIFLSCLSFIPKRSLEHTLNIINCMSFSINTKYTMVYNTNKTSYEQYRMKHLVLTPNFSKKTT